MSPPATPLTVHRVAAGESTQRTLAIIGDRLDAGADPARIAVLARVASALLPVQVALADAGIGHTAPLDPHVLRRTGVRTALAYLRLGLDLERIRREDLLETLNRPARKVKSAVLPLLPNRRLTIDTLERVADALSPTHQERFVGYLDDLRHLEARITHGADTATCLATIRQRIGLGEAVDALDASRSRPEGSSHGDDLDALEQLAHLQPRPEELEAWLGERLRVPGDDAGVTLATVHRVKGREWPHVVVIGATTGLFPHRLAEDDEEERRVFHVAITRCQRTVDVVAETGRVSPFVDELTAAGADDRPGPTPPGTAGTTRPASASTSDTTGTTDAASDRTLPHVPARFHPDGALVTTAGVAVALPGGFDGRVQRAASDHVAVRLLAGPTVRLGYGSPVTVDERTSSFGPPPVAASATRSGDSRPSTDRTTARGSHDPQLTGVDAEDPPVDDRLFEALRRWRAGVAGDTGVPPYVVFHDRHLQVIAGRKPTSLKQLGDCPGVGPTKLERYGDDLLEIIAEHLDDPDTDLDDPDTDPDDDPDTDPDDGTTG